MHANFRGIIQRKMQILSSFTQLHVFSNLYDLLSSVKHKIKYLKKMHHSMEVNGVQSSYSD